MTKIDDIIAAEAEATDNTDLPDKLPEHVEVSQPNKHRTKVFSLRLSDDELAGIERAADEARLPVRTLVRAWILDRLHGKTSPGVDDRLAERVAQLEQAVYQKTQSTTKAG